MIEIDILFEYHRMFYNMRIFEWDVRDDFC